VDAGSREENASKQESSTDLFGPKPAPHAGFATADDCESEAQAAFRQLVVRLHEERETSLDRKITIAAWIDQSP
jgi:hypothetical protein